MTIQLPSPKDQVARLVPVGSIWRRFRGRHKNSCMEITAITPTGVVAKLVPKRYGSRRSSKASTTSHQPYGQSSRTNWATFLAFYTPEGNVFTDRERTELRQAILGWQTPTPTATSSLDEPEPEPEPEQNTGEPESDMIVELDANDNVIATRNGPSETGRRWRFQRVDPTKPAKYFSGAPIDNEEKVQELLAYYVDYKELPVKEVLKHFGIDPSTLYRYLNLYGVSLRDPELGNRQSRAKRASPVHANTPIPSTMAGPVQPPKPQPQSQPQPGRVMHTFRVTVLRWVTEDVEAESLSDLESRYGADAEIQNVEKLK